jgi:hypothetical protein
MKNLLSLRLSRVAARLTAAIGQSQSAERGHMTEEGSETFVPDANQITAQTRKNRRNAQARTRHLQAESLGMQRQCLICGYWTERWLLTGKSSAVAEGSFPHSKSASRKRTLLVRDIC